MYFIAKKRNKPEDSDVAKIKREIVIASSAVSIGTAELFRTGVGKLATLENGDDFPQYDENETPVPELVPLGDYEIRMVRTSENAASDIVNGDTGRYQVMLYIGAVGVEPGDGIYKAHFILHTQG